jgi:hypothetical protein
VIDWFRNVTSKVLSRCGCVREVVVGVVIDGEKIEKEKIVVGVGVGGWGLGRGWGRSRGRG